MKIFFSEFHPRTNLTAPLLSLTQLQNQNFEICKFKGLLQIPNFECYFEFLVYNMMKVFTRPTSASVDSYIEKSANYWSIQNSKKLNVPTRVYATKYFPYKKKKLGRTSIIKIREIFCSANSFSLKRVADFNNFKNFAEIH
jgi:hypothetical protein